MELYYISLHAIEETMRDQFGEPDEQERRKRRRSVPERHPWTTRMRLVVSAGLYRLANALDPALSGAAQPSARRA